MRFPEHGAEPAGEQLTPALKDSGGSSYIRLMLEPELQILSLSRSPVLPKATD